MNWDVCEKIHNTGYFSEFVNTASLYPYVKRCVYVLYYLEKERSNFGPPSFTGASNNVTLARTLSISIAYLIAYKSYLVVARRD